MKKLFFKNESVQTEFINPWFSTDSMIKSKQFNFKARYTQI